MTVCAAPAAMPVSASKLLVATLTVSIDSADWTYIAWCGSQTFTDTAPSTRVVFAFGCVPFTHVRSERRGRVDLGVLELGGRRARHQVQQRLVVPVPVQRQAGHVLGRSAPC